MAYAPVPAAYTKGRRSHCLRVFRTARQGLPVDPYICICICINQVSLSTHSTYICICICICLQAGKPTYAGRTTTLTLTLTLTRLEGRPAQGGQLPRHAPSSRGVARGPRASAAPRRGRRRRVREEPLECVTHRSLLITPCSLIITPRCARNHFGATPRARAECGRLESWEDVAVLLRAVEEAHALLP